MITGILHETIPSSFQPQQSDNYVTILGIGYSKCKKRRKTKFTSYILLNSLPKAVIPTLVWRACYRPPWMPRVATTQCRGLGHNNQPFFPLLSTTPRRASQHFFHDPPYTKLDRRSRGKELPHLSRLLDPWGKGET